MTNDHSVRSPSTDGESAICASSLNNSPDSIHRVVERLRFDAVRCELQFSKGVAKNIEEAATLISELQAELLQVRASCAETSNSYLRRAEAAEARHPPFNDAIEAAWQPIETAPRDGTWILIAEDHCWPPDLVRWQPERKERVINGNRYHPVPAGWFGSPGGRSRFDVPDGHLMKATRWMPLPKSRSLKLPDYRGGEAGSTKTAECDHSPSTLNTRTE